MAGWSDWLMVSALGASISVQALAATSGQAAALASDLNNEIAQPAGPADNCRTGLIGTWTWSGVNRTLERQGMAAVEMETRMELRADGSFVQRQRSRAIGEEWSGAEGRGAWSAAGSSDNGDPRHCVLTMEGNQIAILLNDADSFSLPGLGISYRRTAD